MNMKNLAASAVAIAGLAVGGPALAQQKDSGWYIGGGLGQSRVNIDEAGINAGIVAQIPGLTAVTSSDETDTGWKLYGGYQFNKNIALELTYADLGKFNTFTTFTGVARGSGTGDIKLQNNWSGDVLGILPFGNGFSVFGRLGLLYSETKTSATATRTAPLPVVTVGLSQSDNEWSYKFGLGVGYEFTPQFGIRGEWERYRVSDGAGGTADADLWSVSVRYKF
jgi:OOP family OmpA-OmpF porin